MARVLYLSPDHPDPAAIAEAGAIIRSGGLVAFPTETVYGLGANALDPEAVADIYRAKGRPEYNPLIVHVADADAARDITDEWPPHAATLAAAFWPGPLTLVLRKNPIIPDVVTAGLGTVGVRVPNHPVALALVRAAGRPVAAPSANLFMALSPTAGGHVSGILADRVDLILDAGPASVGIESTVVDLTAPIPTILRPGIISAAQLERLLGDVRASAKNESGPRASPGMFDRHYAPHALVVVVDAARLAPEVQARLADDAAVAVITHGDRSLADGPMIARLPDDAPSYARLLYATLHAFDEAGVAVVIVEQVPEGSEWDGVRDRLSRAAHRPP